MMPPSSCLGAGFGQHYDRIILRMGARALKIQMVGVLMGDEYQISLWQFFVIRHMAEGIDVNDLALERQHQGPMPQERHGKVAG